MRRKAILSPCFFTQSAIMGSMELQCGQEYMKNSITSTFLPVSVRTGEASVV
ncbi:hypothetical protein D3C87_2191340 [compost metagenome]